MPYPEKRGAKLARWLAARRMQIEQERLAQLGDRPMPQFATPRMFSAGPLEFFNSMPARIDRSAASAPGPRQDYWNLNSEEFHQRQQAKREGAARACLDGDCSTAYIPVFPDKMGDDFGNLYITFENDEKGKPNTQRPIHAVTADTIVQAARDAGLQHININSTYRKPIPNKTSRHFSAQAVDINRINGMRVDDPANAANVAALQAALDRQPHIRENFGPTRNEKTEISSKGYAIKADFSWNPKIVRKHRNHIHASTDEKTPKLPPPAPRLKPRRMP